MAGLDLMSAAGFRRGADSGTLVDPADLDNSRLLKAISYQDTEVHTGTIYKACGWTAAFLSKGRVRNRHKPRVGTNRPYRQDINGITAAMAPKVRWEKAL